MGLTCSKLGPGRRRRRHYVPGDRHDHYHLGSADPHNVPDPEVYDVWRRSVLLTQQQRQSSEQRLGQHHLLYKHQHHHHYHAHRGGAAGKKKSHQNKSQMAAERLPLQIPNTTAPASLSSFSPPTTSYPTRLLIRRHPVRPTEEGVSGTHIYAVRWCSDETEQNVVQRQEQCPTTKQQPPPREQHSDATVQAEDSDAAATATATATNADNSILSSSAADHQMTAAMPSSKQPTPLTPTVAGGAPTTTKTKTNGDEGEDLQLLSTDVLFQPETMSSPPKRRVLDWVTVSDEHRIYVADVGLTNDECERMVWVTEQVCRGQYAAYTYAKQTLGCREFPSLAVAVQDAVHSVTHAILQFSNGQAKPQQQQTKNDNEPFLLEEGTNTTSTTVPPRLLALDDREPHMVKYDVTRKERQKLDMHTDKSEWTFLISLSNGCHLDYAGGGTYFECLDATIHVQRGHALIFPGKLRHCGQRITSGLRFLLVGFLVDKAPPPNKSSMTSTSVGGSKKKVIHDDYAGEPSYLNNIP